MMYLVFFFAYFFLIHIIFLSLNIRQFVFFIIGCLFKNFFQIYDCMSQLDCSCSKTVAKNLNKYSNNDLSANNITKTY